MCRMRKVAMLLIVYRTYKLIIMMITCSVVVLRWVNILIESKVKHVLIYLMSKQVHVMQIYFKSTVIQKQSCTISAYGTINV